MNTASETQAWARRCADVTRGRLAETEAWEQIAKRGEEWEVARHKNGKPFRGGPMMTPNMCFTNSARIVGGLTSFDPHGCRYAEGFALGYLGLWYHHGWVVNAFGLVIERTWKEPGERYVGVTFTDFPRDIGCCQLGDWPFGHAWGPKLADEPEAADAMWNRT